MILFNRPRCLFLLVFSSVTLSGCITNSIETSENVFDNDVIIPSVEQVFVQEDPVKSAISLSESLARAVKTNMMFRSRQIENAASISGYQASNYTKLQDLLYKDSNHTRLIDPGRLKCDTDNERELVIAAEQQRKITQELVADVHTSYWQVVALQRVNSKVYLMEKELYDALDYAKVIYSDNVKPPLEALQYQRSLRASIYQLQQFKTEYILAKSRFATLMGLDPKKSYSLVRPRNYSDPLPLNRKNGIQSLESLALTLRPEIRQAYCSPALIKEKQTLNLRSLLTQSDRGTSNSKRQLALAKLASEAFNAIGGLNQAYLSYAEARTELNLAGQVVKQDRAVIKSAAGTSATQLSEHLAIINQKMDEVISQRHYELAYAKWQAAAAKLILELGHDRIPNIDHTKSISSLSGAIKKTKLLP